MLPKLTPKNVALLKHLSKSAVMWAYVGSVGTCCCCC